MAHILEESTPGMRPEQEKKGIAKAIESKRQMNIIKIKQKQIKSYYYY